MHLTNFTHFFEHAASRLRAPLRLAACRDKLPNRIVGRGRLGISGKN